MSPRDFAQLFKLPISIVSTVSAATGFVAFTHALTWRLVPTSGAILLLAFAACALNQAQECQRDALMDRTRLRPIPSGRISPVGAVAWSAILALSALTALFLLGGTVAAGLGALAVLWYNGIYTYLKRVSSLAPVVGSVIGAIPPAIGWVCAGGALGGPILSLSFFLLMWQVPHFWLLALRATATAASALLLPIFGLSSSPFLGLGLAAAGAWLTFIAWRALRTPDQQGFRQAFHAINYYAVMVMGAVILDAVLGR